MELSSINLIDRLLKITLGANFLLWGITFSKPVAASTFTSINYNYNLEDDGYFSLKLSGNSYNKLDNRILQQELEFSEYINSILNEENQNEYLSAIQSNILVKSQLTEEQRLMQYLLGSLKQLEFEKFSNDSLIEPAIPVLPQVAYGNIYQDIYDFEVSLVGNPSRQPRTNKKIPKQNSSSSIKSPTVQPRETKYFASYFQASIKPNNSVSLNSSLNSSSLNSEINNTPSLLTSSQQTASSINLLNSQLTGFPLLSNQGELNSLIEIPTDSLTENNLSSNSGNNSEADVYLPATEIEAYQLKDVPSHLNSYQKPEHQEQLEKILEKQKKQLERQRERMHQQLEKIQEARERARQKEAQQYQKIREKQLNQTINQQKQIQEQLLNQIQ